MSNIRVRAFKIIVVLIASAITVCTLVITAIIVDHLRGLDLPYEPAFGTADHISLKDLSENGLYRVCFITPGSSISGITGIDQATISIVLSSNVDSDEGKWIVVRDNMTAVRVSAIRKKHMPSDYSKSLCLLPKDRNICLSRNISDGRYYVQLTCPTKEAQ